MSCTTKRSAAPLRPPMTRTAAAAFTQLQSVANRTQPAALPVRAAAAHTSVAIIGPTAFRRSTGWTRKWPAPRSRYGASRRRATTTSTSTWSWRRTPIASSWRASRRCSRRRTRRAPTRYRSCRRSWRATASGQRRCRRCRASGRAAIGSRARCCATSVKGWSECAMEVWFVVCVHRSFMVLLGVGMWAAIFATESPAWAVRWCRNRASLRIWSKTSSAVRTTSINCRQVSVVREIVIDVHERLCACIVLSVCYLCDYQFFSWNLTLITTDITFSLCVDLRS